MKIALPLKTRIKRLEIKILRKTPVVQSKVFVVSIQPQEDPFVYYDNIDNKAPIRPTLPYDGCAFCLKPYNHG